MSVDLPAPFWPTSAMTSAGSTSSEADFSAGTPANALEMPCMDRSMGLLPIFAIRRPIWGWASSAYT
ncbi:hypothetical protein D3C87_2054250 [compost metagenome]